MLFTCIIKMTIFAFLKETSAEYAIGQHSAAI